VTEPSIDCIRLALPLYEQRLAPGAGPIREGALSARQQLAMSTVGLFACVQFAISERAAGRTPSGEPTGEITARLALAYCRERIKRAESAEVN